MELHDTIKRVREAKRLSQYDLAEMLGISQSAYAQIEKGKTDLTVKRLIQIAEVFDVSILELLGEIPDKDTRVGQLEKELADLRSTIQKFKPIFEFVKGLQERTNTQEGQASKVKSVKPQTRKSILDDDSDGDLQ